MQNALVAQSGGPTAAINASLAGIIQACWDSPQINRIYGGKNGIAGIMEEKIVDFETCLHSSKELHNLKLTPAMALGSCRLKLPCPEENSGPYEKIAEIFEKYSVGYFFYIGGNDSMDTVEKLSRYFKDHGSNIKIIGVPKTIDNDLPCTDHAPGFGSAAKYIATSMAEMIADTRVYHTRSVLIVEIMGRNAGFLTAAAALPSFVGFEAPHLVYLPECVFDEEQFLQDIRRLHKPHHSVIVAVAEGIRGHNGRYVGEAMQSGKTDIFGHQYLAGTGQYLEQLVNDKIGCKVRSVDLNILQRCAMHCNSKTDIDESFAIGSHAVSLALNGHSGKCAVFIRVGSSPYKMELGSCDVKEIANKEKTVPASWINSQGNHVTREAFDYILPLIQGSYPAPEQMGLPTPFFLSPQA